MVHYVMSYIQAKVISPTHMVVVVSIIHSSCWVNLLILCTYVHLCTQLHSTFLLTHRWRC